MAIYITVSGCCPAGGKFVIWLMVAKVQVSGIVRCLPHFQRDKSVVAVVHEFWWCFSGTAFLCWTGFSQVPLLIEDGCNTIKFKSFDTIYDVHILCIFFAGASHTWRAVFPVATPDSS